MSKQPSITITGIGPGEVPGVAITIPLNGEHAELAERLLGLFLGTTVQKLTTRGGDGDDNR